MKSADLSEAVSIVTDVLVPALLRVVQGESGLSGAQLRYQCGVLTANAATMLNASPSGDNSFWISIAKCFDAAQVLSTFAQMEFVRSSVDATAPTGPAAVAVKNFSIRMALAEEAKILAATTFTSRQQIDNYFDVINAAFDSAELVAADNHDNVAYTAIVRLHAAVSNDLANRAQPLPRIVTYTTRKRRSSLVLAQTLYQDPSRSDELIAENRPVRPLFMPTSIRALAR